MAITSAEKRAITSEKSRVRRKSRNAAIKTTEKRLRSAIASSDVPKAKEVYKEVSGKLDKAAKVGTIHKNKANRKKSRIAKAINKAAKA